MDETFQKAYNDFLNEYRFELGNSWSFRKDIGRKIFKLTNGSFDEAISIIIKGHGEHIQFVGEKAIELFINYMKLYKIKSVSDEDLKIVIDYIRQLLSSRATEARRNCEAYHASKGGAPFVFLNINVLWVGEELEHKIPKILEKMKIELKKYLIMSNNDGNNSTVFNIQGDVNKSQFNIDTNNSIQNNSK
ncbi:hypothetical protein [Flavobacterium filum]|uniref:hypothetical protein n=1 Tax=Flavobacterium filum TaxID=370974 RepID=UPI0023EFF4C4|nr:hypothetical protein [Flavobacterium filum]